MTAPNRPPEDLEHAWEDLDLLRRRIVDAVGHALPTAMATRRGFDPVLEVPAA